MFLRFRQSLILRNIMIRSSNSVSVIELNLGAADNQNNPNPSANDIPALPETENASLSSSNESSVEVSNAAGTLKALDSQEGSSSVILNDKVIFKLKMKDILSCKICMELRRCPMYQCKYGHLICAGCFNDMLAESHLQNEIASCPKCQTTITKDLCFRNVAVEKTISELPITCLYCSSEFLPENLKYHENICKNKPTVCSNNIIGCSWQGRNLEKETHEQSCAQPSANGYQILKSLTNFDNKQKEGVDIYNKIIELLSIEKVDYTDLQLKHSKTENESIIFETSKFISFDVQWVIRACITDFSKGVSLSYQLVLKSKMISPMTLHYILLRGPYNEMEIKPQVCEFKFSEKAMESPYQVLDIPKTLDKDMFHSAKRINIRILMFNVR